MIQPVLLLLLVAATTAVSQRRFGRNPPQEDNTGSWEGDVICTDERSCREYWRNVGLSYAEYYASRLGLNPSRHRHRSSNQDRPGASSDSSSSSSSSSSEESSHRGRRSVDSEEDNYSVDSDLFNDDYNEDYNGDDGKQSDGSPSSASPKPPTIENKKNHRNIRSVYLGYDYGTDDFVNRRDGGFRVKDQSSYETGNGMLGRDSTRPGYWRRKAYRKYPQWLKPNKDCTETPRKEGIFKRPTAAARKPCKYSPWSPPCTWKVTSKPTRRLPTTISPASKSTVRYTSTPAVQPSTQSSSTPAVKPSTQSTSGPAQEQSSVSTSRPAEETTTELIFSPVIT